jgi:thioredoxin 1
MSGNYNVIHATDENFEREVLKSEKPSLVDFWAPWCSPCRIIGPVLEELAAEFKDRVKIVKVNVDDCPNTAAAYKIMSIPTIILFRDGTAAGTFVGLVPKEALARLIVEGSGK